MVIRKATKEDLEGIAKVHVNSWNETYTGLMPQSYLDKRSVEGQLQYYQQTPNIEDLFNVLEIKNEVVGFVTAIPARDKDFPKREYGEIQAIYLLKKYHDQGYGGMLLDYGIAILEQKHFKYVSLWVLDTNEKAIGFYEHEGFCKDGATKEIVLDDHPLTEIRMTKKIHHYIVEEEED